MALGPLPSSARLPVQVPSWRSSSLAPRENKGGERAIPAGAGLGMARGGVLRSLVGSGEGKGWDSRRGALVVVVVAAAGGTGTVALSLNRALSPRV